MLLKMSKYFTNCNNVSASATDVLYDCFHIAIGCAVIISIVWFTIDIVKFVLELSDEYRRHYKETLVGKLIEITDYCFDTTMYDFTKKHSVDSEYEANEDSGEDDENDEDNEDNEDNEVQSYGSGKTLGEDSTEDENNGVQSHGSSETLGEDNTKLEGEHKLDDNTVEQSMDNTTCVVVLEENQNTTAPETSEKEVVVHQDTS